MAIGATLTPVGISSDKFYKHEQSVLSTVWTIEHGLDKQPSVSAYYMNNMMHGIVRYLTNNTLEIEFSVPCRGIAICN